MVSAAASDRPRGRLAGPDRHGAVDLLADQADGQVGVDRPEHAPRDAVDHQVVDEPGDVESDQGQLASRPPRAPRPASPG